MASSNSWIVEVGMDPAISATMEAVILVVGGSICIASSGFVVVLLLVLLTRRAPDWRYVIARRRSPSATSTSRSATPGCRLTFSAAAISVIRATAPLWSRLLKRNLLQRLATGSMMRVT